MLNKNAKELPEVGERKQIAVKRLSPEYWRVNIDNPPLNIMGAQMVAEFAELVDEIERDDALKVVVFGSENREYFMAHYSVLGDIADSLGMPLGPLDASVSRRPRETESRSGRQRRVDTRARDRVGKRNRPGM